MSEAKSFIRFHCNACGVDFDGKPARVEDAPEQEWHPFSYFAPCPACTAEAPQASWERNLWKAWTNRTGATTPEGKARVAQNLEGHPTPEEAKRTRFNAMKHGLYAKTANYYPAKPGKYPHCAECEHFGKACQANPPRSHRNPPACLKRIELFMNFHVAFESRDPGMLTRYMADIQAMAFQLTNDMIRQVIMDGTALSTPEWHFDKEGKLHIAEYTDANGLPQTILRTKAHPLLPLIIEMMSRNGMALPDSGMTMKVKDEQETVRGFLEGQGQAAESALEFQERQTRSLEQLSVLVARSQQRQARDPVLLEHAAIEQGADA